MRTAAREAKQHGPQFVRYFGPVLDALRALGGSGTPDEVVDRIASELNVSDEIQNELLASGESRYRNQVAWARFYLVKEGLLDSSKRGVWSLTEHGHETHLSAQEAQELFRKWSSFFGQQRRRKPNTSEADEEHDEAQPELATDIDSEVLELLARLPPAGFERLSQRLLREAGFTQVVVTGKSGDGGIDGYGTLQVNPLVSFKVLFQCKRYRGSVTPSQVRDFRGAMQGRADKGIIITTGGFTAEARREASRDGVPPIEVIDGEKLVEMFKQLELGLKPVTTYEVDDAFFEEFRK